MKEKIELDELKAIEFRLLLQFRDICDKNGINYSLTDGTLLGAVRHKGFIPWDDDVDIIMSRPDYEKFAEYCTNNSTPFDFVSYKTNPDYGYLFAKIADPNTILVGLTGDTSGKTGVFMDIFIYDGMGDTPEQARKNFNRTLFKRELLVAANWPRFSRSKTRSIIYEPIRFAFFLLSRFANRQKLLRSIDATYSGLDFNQCKYVGNLGSGCARSIIERTYVDSYTELEFEGEMFKVMSGYESYLTNIYGDYMQLPPENKRITHHTFDAFYKSESEREQ